MVKSFRNIQQDKAPPSAKDLVDLPLADALKIYVHPGEKPKVKRGPRAQYTDEIGEKLSRKQVDEMREAQRDAKYAKLFDYYAGTDVPFERVAQHLKLDLQFVVNAMRNRGRLS